MREWKGRQATNTVTFLTTNLRGHLLPALVNTKLTTAVDEEISESIIIHVEYCVGIHVR